MLFNPAHLDHLSEEIDGVDAPCRIVHIYAEAPDYQRISDPAEGTACVDDVARAAVVFLRSFELTGDEGSRDRAEGFLRFIMHMQTPAGLFYNFVTDNRLTINREHFRSRADKFEWWSARAVWALGMGAWVLRSADPELASECARRVRRALPHASNLLDRYPQTQEYRGRCLPTWLINECAADATSELLLGLAAYNRAQPSVEVQTMITHFAEGIALMRYGSMNRFPYGAHASSSEEWHLWGNSQTQALAEAGIVTSAKLEAEHFYPRLLVEGFLHSIVLDDLHAMRYRERIAYGVRAVAVGLLRLFEVCGDERFLKMAGLAATWFTGNNEAGEPMYDPASGRGYDGLNPDGQVNYNSGAESTLEALYTMLEIEQYPLALTWLNARPEDAVRVDRDGIDYLYRIFEDRDASSPRRVALVMNLTRESFDVLEDNALDQFIAA